MWHMQLAENSNDTQFVLLELKQFYHTKCTHACTDSCHKQPDNKIRAKFKNFQQHEFSFWLVLLVIPD